MTSNLALERLTYVVKGKLKDLDKIWPYFLHYCNQVDQTIWDD